MIYRRKERTMTSFFVVVGVIITLILYLTVTTTFGQSSRSGNAVRLVHHKFELSAARKNGQTSWRPVFTAYRGITIGMPADEVRRKLVKKPRFADSNGLYYVFSEQEKLQIVFDRDKKVKLISIMYAGENADAPAYEEVFGSGVPLETSPGGRIYKLVNYDDAGFWIAYYRSAGEHPKTTITIQKIWNAD